jgi:hypothetical protein
MISRGTEAWRSQETLFYNMRFEGLTAACLKMTVLWDTEPYSVLQCCPNFRDSWAHLCNATNVTT